MEWPYPVMLRVLAADATLLAADVVMMVLAVDVVIETADAVISAPAVDVRPAGCDCHHTADPAGLSQSLTRQCCALEASDVDWTLPH